MAGWLAFVKVVTLLTHVYTRPAWVLALLFVTRHARVLALLFITRWARPLRTALMAAAVVTAVMVAATIGVAGILSWLSGVGGAWAAAIVAAAFTAAARIHAVMLGAPPSPA